MTVLIRCGEQHLEMVERVLVGVSEWAVSSNDVVLWVNIDSFDY